MTRTTEELLKDADDTVTTAVLTPYMRNLIAELSAKLKEGEVRQKSLQKIVDIQCCDGNWNFDPYMHGLANGMIMCMAVLKGEEPVFLQAPKVWSSERGDQILEMGELSVAVTTPPKKEG